MLNSCSFLGSSALLLCLFLVSLLFSVAVSEISLGSKLSVSDYRLWVSPNGDFALGFFNNSDHVNQFSLGIRFDSDTIPIDKKAVVWVAGAELTVSNQSYLQLTQREGLVLFDPSNGGVVWKSNTAGKPVASASLQDDGNLVVLDGNKDLVWQSFDTPSDTLLPGQFLSVHKTLRALSGNSLSSHYSLYLNDSRQLQLRWETDMVYWVGGSPSNGSLRASLSSNGSFQLLDERSEAFWSVFVVDHNDNVTFRFLRLDVDGNLRMYSWDEDSVSWRSVWQAVENQCNVFATCGDHGICSFANNSLPTCKCSFGSTMQSNSKCSAPQQICDTNVSMVEHMHTSVYGIYPPNDTVSVTSLDLCRNSCQKDPLCTAVTYLEDGSAQCWIKKTRYITGYSDPSLSSISFVKTCQDPLPAKPNYPAAASLPPPSFLPSNNQSSRSHIRSVIDAALVSFCLFCMLQIAVGIWVCKRRVANVRKQNSLPSHGLFSAGLVRWTYGEIKELTGNFKDQLGPRSYKAMLQNNQLALIRRLELQIEERKFRAMVSLIGSIHHKHLVKVEGFCCDPGHRFLVYEFLKNGSLEDFMHRPASFKKLTWKNRMLICLGVAKALLYLHTQCRDFVSHGNLTCKNVILDENLEAKVTEFGLQRLDGIDTFAEKDVEDFGKIVLYLICGRQEVHEDICEWSYNKWVSGYGWRVVDKRTEGDVDFDELERALRIAFWCLQVDERMRPSMSEVVNVLEGTLTVDPPPPPFSDSRALLEDRSTDSEVV
ncbi:G-type lectin S-receptor-like serine/threonine-protein kinase SD3-1 [Chenopodium quinoa]|uniref:G-type lectin S-receptor-like serine/threonine-protein kinase SD3-1 n=1 Tax=Chenopodium quinoa TaxID=63459 RepID=UPI000B77E9A1|nr:G-type lectin S-receptor-like serine/threonine-protein kinase SD3-1 [Chenopodium quinoa]